MCSVGHVRHQSRDDLLAQACGMARLAERLQRDMLDIQDRLTSLVKDLDGLIDSLRDGKPVPPEPEARVLFRFSGGKVLLRPALWKLLKALAAGGNARREAEWQSIEEVRARLQIGAKKPLSRRAVIQAASRLRKEFAHAGFSGDLLASADGGWKLRLSPTDLASLRERCSDAG